MKVMMRSPLFLVTLLALCLGAGSLRADPANVFDRAVLHPAIPLVDEQGQHVLNSGKPYSPKMSCGNGAGGGCHDYEGMTHAYHFEQGRDEARDDFGTKRGLNALVSPGYFGGFNCMQASLAASLAKKTNANAGEFGDFGAAGQVRICGSCHAGGGWGELDRDGNRYDATPDSVVRNFDGDYFDRLPSGEVARWDWRRSGTREADCLICHLDLAALKKFPASGLGANDAKDGSASARQHWGTLQDVHFLQRGFFRYASSAILEFTNVRPDLPDGQPLLSVARAVRPGSAAPDYDLALGASGEPVLNWNRAAFDGSGKVQIPMLRFPASDNCMTCHLTGEGVSRTASKTTGSRRGFYGFGEDSRQTQNAEGDWVFAMKADVHTGKSWTDDNGETRIIDNCNACHTKQYYKPLFANIDLDANHDFPKGNGDADVRNDLDYQPDPKSCLYCHSTARNPALPSGQRTLLSAHRERWKASGDMFGYAPNTLDRVVQVHFDDLDCQACHSHKVDYNGKPLTLHYRYRLREDGASRVIPYVPSARFIAKDKTSGRVLYRHERLAVLRAKSDTEGAIVDPASGQEIGRVPVSSGEFGMPATYADFRTLKQAYDKLLAAKGDAKPDVRFVFLESNEYLLTHQTRRGSEAVTCDECHTRKQNGSVNGAVASTGLVGTARTLELGRIPDKRLVDEGVVELAMPYHQVLGDGRIVETVGAVFDVTTKAPDMSILKAATSPVISGPLTPTPADQAAAFAELGAGAGPLMARMNSGEWLLFHSKNGAPAVRSVALMIPGTAINRLRMQDFRVEVSAHAPDKAERKRLRTLGSGRQATDIFALTMTKGSQPPVTQFDDVDAWLKLPYAGSASKPGKVRVVFSANGKRWRRLPTRNISVVQPGAGGYVAVKLGRPYPSFLAVLDATGQK